MELAVPWTTFDELDAFCLQHCCSKNPNSGNKNLLQARLVGTL